MLDLFERNRWAFGLLELCVVLIVIAVLAALLLPTLGRSRTSGRQLPNNTQVRGIHQSMVIFAQGNNGYFPGLSADGELLEAGAIFGTTEDGAFPGARYVILMDANYFPGEYAISPLERSKTEWTTAGTPITTDQFSFGMLALDLDADGRLDRPDAIVGSDGRTTRPGGRTAEWSETLNTEAPVMADRNTGADAAGRVSSIHTQQDSGDWRGSVAWNDNHVVFETTPSLSTKFGDGPFRDEALGQGDHLFVADSPNAIDDAAIVFQDGQTLDGQR
ncbi:MAG: type II secretion system protein [Planctomycetota bacterium]